MLNYIKTLLKLISRLILRVFYLIPLQNKRVVFESFYGKQISCNPYYIYKELCKCEGNLELIWVIRSSLFIPNGVRFVRKNSLQYFYVLLTAKVFISNTEPMVYVPFRKRQIIINTWHGGGAYKRCGIDVALDKTLFVSELRKSAMMTTYLLSSSKMFTEKFALSMLVPRSKCIATGMPRNDIFFNSERMKLCVASVNEKLKILADAFVVLYAPTYRKEATTPTFEFNLDVLSLVKVIKNKFSSNNIVILFRGHHTFSSMDKSLLNVCITNVSDYPNMQELLCRANILISDYSSCIWDYSFTYRPCFLFTPDLDEYQSERDFYIPIKEWGFPVAKTNVELKEQIENFDEVLFKQAMLHHHEQLGSYECGDASGKVVSLIMDRLKI